MLFLRHLLLSRHRQALFLRHLLFLRRRQALLEAAVKEMDGNLVSLLAMYLLAALAGAQVKISNLSLSES